MALPRPRTLTLLGWLFTAFGTVYFFLMLPQLGNPEVQRAFTEASGGSQGLKMVYMAALVIAPLILVSGGIGILLGKNWSRWLILISGTGALLASLAFGAFEPRSLPGLALFALIIYQLFKPVSTAYFRGIEERKENKE